MTDKPHLTMSPDELAIELFTTGQSMNGGRAEAERLLKQIKERHAHELAEQQRAHGNAEDGEPGCWHDGVTSAANLIDPEKQP